MQSLSSNKRVRDSDESLTDLVDAKRILLDILDESDTCTVSQDLDSFIKSFQDDISPSPEIITGKISDSGESTESTELADSRPELGFLLEASDDELGLPPSEVNTSSTELADSVELSGFWGLDDQISFEYEFGYGDVNISGEYVALDGLFDYTDLGFGQTLPAQ